MEDYIEDRNEFEQALIKKYPKLKNVLNDIIWKSGHCGYEFILVKIEPDIRVVIEQFHQEWLKQQTPPK